MSKIQGNYQSFFDLDLIISFLFQPVKFSMELSPLERLMNQSARLQNMENKRKRLKKIFLSIGCAGVLRLTKVIYPEMSLLKGWTEKLKQWNEIEAYVDRCFAPLDIDRAVKKISSLIENKEVGIHHCFELEELPYFDFAIHLAKSLGLNQNLVKGIHCPDSKLVPRFASLLS
jgi:hypothetical protein